MLGAVLARQVGAHLRDGASPQVAYGAATGHIFWISAAVALLGVVAAVLLKAVPLRTSLDLPNPTKPPAAAAVR